MLSSCIRVRTSQNSLRPKEKTRSVNPSRRGRIRMGGVSIYVQLHFVPRRRSVGSHHTFPSIPTWYHLGAAWRAIALLEVEGTRRRTLPARSSRYACAARTLKASRSRFSNCQFHCQTDCM